MSGKNLRFDTSSDQKKRQLIYKVHKVATLGAVVAIILITLRDHVHVRHRVLVEFLFVSVFYTSICTVLWCYNSLPETSGKWNAVMFIVTTLSAIIFLVGIFL